VVVMMDSSWSRQQGLKLSAGSLLSGLGVIFATSVGATMVVMNPSQSTYESYATQQVMGLIDQNICGEAPKAFNLRQDCKSLLTQNRAEVQQFIANNTTRQNFIFFSVYTTDVSVASFLPHYRVETVGALRRFHTYDATRN
jgi:hypothetical protein